MPADVKCYVQYFKKKDLIKTSLLLLSPDDEGLQYLLLLPMQGRTITGDGVQMRTYITYVRRNGDLLL